MQHACITRYTVKPGAIDEVVRRVTLRLARIYRDEPGFFAYWLITSGDSLVTASVWRMAAQAEAAAQLATTWAREQCGDLIDATEQQLGDVAFFWVPSASGARGMGLLMPSTG